ncbi:hypothetical protein CCR85_10380 [Rhodothalassium salexigens]|uniref:tetratricopeptide repeat-containing sulfotransferase family protein n=1 Tax=Rhodothalassium salexigens TaxID=1086 RepID=UPI0019128509|nr:tetratricopeptide repeat-containing sulfotransferase family protein [Rhodothalassium salexigens]MBK5911894.1 hypothetical protein [Rhodothalassium salexigens]MBK5920969.1 hypothetical protein [Rhodothalassium salexigens]
MDRPSEEAIGSPNALRRQQIVTPETAARPAADADPLAQARHLLQAGRPAEAAAAAAAVLAERPDDTEALYVQAVARRFLKHYDEAAAVLAKLKRLSPQSGRVHQEDGHLRRDRGDAAGALTAYERATAANPGLMAAWREQARLFAAAGQTGRARWAEQQAERLAALPRELVSVTSFLHEGKLGKAETLCRHFLQRHPHHIEAMRLLAEIGERFNALDEAEFLLESAAEFDPDNTQVRLDYIKVLRKRQKVDAALAQARILYDRDPDNPVFQSSLGIESQIAGDTDTALAMFDKVLAKVPDDPVTWMSKGHALKTVGRTDEAVAAYRAAYTAKPDHGDAFWSLANLKTYRFTDAEMARMAALEADPETGWSDRVHLGFALGKAHEDAGAYETSFQYYDRANALKRAQSKYRIDHMDEELAAQAAVCTAELFESRAGQGDPAPDPIFIVGLPRAGSTLIEQILASHSAVDGTMELASILSLSHGLRKRQRITADSPYPRVLHDLPADRLAELGRAYLDETRVHRGSAPFFTDKMPNNFRHLGLIALILPNAKIIDARRHPMACCFSGFKQLFAEGQEFTYGLERMGRYYRGYVDLMDHWDRVLPGRILRVQHEDVVADLEGQVRRLLDFCGLPFETACVDFHKTRRAVRTASSEQVRQPINTDGLEAWQRFEPWLDPLKQALGPALTDYRRDR